MAEKIIYSKHDWEEGSFIGSKVVEESIINNFKELNNNNFNNPIFTNWQVDNKNNDVSKIFFSNSNSQLIFNVDKDSNIDYIEDETFGEISTDFYQDGISVLTDTLLINFDYKSYETNYEEKTVITIFGESNSYQDIIFTNKGSLKLHTYNEESNTYDEIINTHVDSIGDINNFINNSIKNAYLEVYITENNENFTINTRLKGSGYISEWYSFDFGGLIKGLKINQKANKNTNTIVKKDLYINKILIDGYEDGVSYISKIIDSLEDDTEWDNIELTGNFPLKTLYNSEIDNYFTLKIYASNDINNLNDTNERELLINPDNINYTLNNNLILDDEKLTGRYLQIELKICNSKYYQNEINYIKLNYTPPSLMTDVIKQVESGVVSKNIDSSGGIIELDDNNFSFKVYFPENLITEEIEFTIERIAESENLFAEGMIGFKITPHINLSKPALLEVDYTGYQFGTYMSEKGLLLGLININENPEQLNTFKDYKNKKALAYISKT
ncbi:MAG: hypothetical protein ACOCP8_07230 [archaeon]